MHWEIFTKCLANFIPINKDDMEPKLATEGPN